MKIVIKPCTINDVVQSGLLDLYADECQLEGLPRPSADISMYEEMCGFKGLHVVGAWDNTQLVGFVTVLTIKIAHYGKTLVTIESIFAHADYRKFGAGAKLLRYVEQYAREANAIGLLISAPAGGKLSSALKRSKKYRLSNEVFMRGFSE